MKKILIASDHSGYELKKIITSMGYRVEDLGIQTEESVDYPDFAKKLSNKIVEEKARGVLICGTGIGMSIVANKTKGVRAALCCDEYSARMSREHNDSNVLCLGARVISNGLAKSILEVWLEKDFSKDERHKRRVGKIEEN